jgi:hypothetical protein
VISWGGGHKGGLGEQMPSSLYVKKGPAKKLLERGVGLQSPSKNVFQKWFIPT